MPIDHYDNLDPAEFVMVNTAFITGDILRWARERIDLSYADIAHSLRVDISEVRAWEEGESFPPFGKAQDLARLLKIPFGYLFLSKRPSEDAQIPDFRTIGDQQPSIFSRDFLDTLDHVLLQQEWYREYTEQSSLPRLNFVGRLRMDAGADAVARDIRNYLEINAQLRRSCRDSSAYLTRLSENAQSAGMLVMRGGVVVSDTTRPLDVDEFRGFAIADPIAPVVFVNARDAYSAQVFTLIHEITHVWINQSGISNPDPSDFSVHDFEKFCNKVAARVLVPADDFQAAWSNLVTKDRENFPSQLARTFLVSGLVVIRRAYELNKIDDEEFYWLVQREKRKVLKVRRSTGGDPMKTLLSRNGRRMTLGVLNAVKENRLLYRDAANLLGLSNERLPKLLKKRII
jgi:Zn-dependent peptidase ImmA (M78 family)